jgi:predicted DNA binding protein
MTTPHPEDEGIRQRLEIEFELVPSESCSCAPEEFGEPIGDFDQVSIDGTHHADISVPSSEFCCQDDPGGCVIHRRSDIEGVCPFRAFYLEGWVPRVVDVAGNRVRLQTYLPDRKALSNLVDALERTTEELQVRRLTRINLDGDGTEQNTTTLDLTELTEKQRQAAIVAVRSGYYETPREASLGDLADELEISKSALSRRLNAVEAQVMKTAFGGMTTPTQYKKPQ